MGQLSMTNSQVSVNMADFARAQLTDELKCLSNSTYLTSLKCLFLVVSKHLHAISPRPFVPELFWKKVLESVHCSSWKQSYQETYYQAFYLAVYKQRHQQLVEDLPNVSKSCEISTFIKDNGVDLFFVTETWLSAQGDEAKTAELAPSGFDVKSFPRQSRSRGGGIATVYKSTLGSNITFKTNFDFTHTSFEVVQASITLQHNTLHFFCLYRPPPNRRNNLTDSMFTEQLPDLLDYVNSLPGFVCLVGDMNIHFDNPLQSLTKQTLSTLSLYDLVQVINKPTHRCGHIIDWVIVRPDDDIHRKSTVTDSLESDHYCTKSYFNISVEKPSTLYRTVRNIANIDRPSFIAELSSVSEFSSVENANQFCDFLRTVLDKHAPPSLRKFITHSSSPWFESIRDELFIAKRERRQAERKWMNTKLIRSEGCSLHVVALLDSIWIDKLHRLSLPTGKWAQLPFFGPASHWNPQSGWHYSY